MRKQGETRSLGSWRPSGKNFERGVVSRKECVEKPCPIRNKHSVAFSHEDIMVTLVREGSAVG